MRACKKNYIVDTENVSTKRPLSPVGDEPKSKVLSTESRDRSVRHAEKEYDAEAFKHLPVDCSVC